MLIDKNNLDKGLKVIELEDRLETVQIAVDLPISARCDRRNDDCGCPE
ncbi:hypothetical protein [Neolewinella aurantiaca]|nr:hypothetical protein [Neolewinella aurantiaca]